ncbi:CFEM domain-containing protein [Mycena indigotica]|uniref:CFEM domain-containing protein n=1 Tax=Mycena indigotica TaxID=2126181 RepID=A0A8H6SQD3_9AGAR|nr:CFEM domain-containing protein [Mycena indigotica]KAF7303591.1 CFEM domain-containing protein [Mycena indigotica]
MVLFPGRNALLISGFLSGALLVSGASQASATISGVVLPSSTPALDPCMESCFEVAANANNCAIDDVHCACASAQLQADLTQCLDARCDAFAAPQAQGLLIQLCNKVAVVATGTATPNHLSLSATVAAAAPTSPATENGLPSIPTSRAHTMLTTSITMSILREVSLASILIFSLV